MLYFFGYEGGGAVTGEHGGVAGQGEEVCAYAGDEGIEMAAGQIGAAYAACKEHIAGDDPVAGRIIE